MKILLLLLLATTFSYAQKKDSTTYKKVVTINLSDAQILLRSVARWRDLTVYDPEMDDKQKVATYKQLDEFIRRMNTSLKVDSVAVKSKPK